MGARPSRSGNAKLLLPSPPYVVPRREKRAVFCESGRSWPSHQAQPFGAKLNGKIRISATNGSAINNLLEDNLTRVSFDSITSRNEVPPHQSGRTGENSEK